MCMEIYFIYILKQNTKERDSGLTSFESEYKIRSGTGKNLFFFLSNNDSNQINPQITMLGTLHVPDSPLPAPGDNGSEERIVMGDGPASDKTEAGSRPHTSTPDHGATSLRGRKGAFRSHPYPPPNTPRNTNLNPFTAPQLRNPYQAYPSDFRITLRIAWKGDGDKEAVNLLTRKLFLLEGDYSLLPSFAPEDVVWGLILWGRAGGLPPGSVQCVGSWTEGAAFTDQPQQMRIWAIVSPEVEEYLHDHDNELKTVAAAERLRPAAHDRRHSDVS